MSERPKTAIDRVKLTKVRARVTCVDRSPMNPLRWLLTLACGHTTFVTAKRRPTAKWAACPVTPHD